MSTPLLLQFAADHPVSAFFLSCPLALILIAWAWSTATLLTNAMNACAMIYAQTTGFLAVIARGYAPGAGKDEGDGKGGEDKPLAG